MKVECIKKRYRKKEVLNGISFEASKGQCIGIMGGNGSGKSTLLSILAGVIKPDSGRVTTGRIGSDDICKIKIPCVGFVPQGTPLIEELTAYDNLRLWYNKSDMEISLKRGVLKTLGISGFLNVAVHKMSGGMKKRLSIGCVMGCNPDILLLDEPGAALDLLCKERIFEFLTDFKSDGGIVVLVTHDVYELPLCDKLYILKNGVLKPCLFDGDIHSLAGRL